jgi:MFS family permease
MGLCDSLLPALGFRALAGIAMAGMYMPGLRALTHGVEGATRARIAAWYTSSFTIGASLSFLFGRVGTLLGWRSAFVIAGILGAAGVLIAWAALPRGDSGGEEEPQPLRDFRPVLVNRDVLALIVGGTCGSRLRPCADPRKSGSHQTPCWRRQSGANPSLKWESEITCDSERFIAPLPRRKAPVLVVSPG